MLSYYYYLLLLLLLVVVVVVATAAEAAVADHNFNPLNPELNPICHLLALLGAHCILHISRIRVKC